MLTDNKRMVLKVKLVTETQPRDTNDKVILFPLSILVLKHFLIIGTFIKYRLQILKINLLEGNVTVNNLDWTQLLILLRTYVT